MAPVAFILGAISAILAIALVAEGDGSLRIHNDPETGCEYLRAGFGGLYPRLDPTGHPICRHAKPPVRKQS